MDFNWLTSVHYVIVKNKLSYDLENFMLKQCPKELINDHLHIIYGFHPKLYIAYFFCLWETLRNLSWTHWLDLDEEYGGLRNTNNVIKKIK